MMDRRQAEVKLFSSIYKDWLDNGVPVVRQTYPNAIAIVPLYRSAIIVTQQTNDEREQGIATLIIQHDPAWMGYAITEETLREHSCEVVVVGDRHTPTLVINIANCRDGGVKIEVCTVEEA